MSSLWAVPAPFTNVLHTYSRVAHIAGDLLLSAPEKQVRAFHAPLGPDLVPNTHRKVEGETRLCPLLRRFFRILVVVCNELHNLVRGHSELDEFLEDEIIEDQPREIGTIENAFIFPDGLIEIFQRAPAERAFSSDKLVEENLFLASRAGRVGGMHA